jgi:monoamine oxidase
MSDPDVVVIGAGLAGLGAATALRAAGVSALVLEAAGRIGGRACTLYPRELGGVWFDAGAVWLHNAEHNPLVPIAEAAGAKLLRSDELRRKRTLIGDRPATAAELADYAEAWDRFAAAAAPMLAPGVADPPLSAVAERLPDDPWAVTVETWEGPVICAVDANRYSLRDWDRNQLTGSNLVPDGGIGAFVAGTLGEGLEIRLDTPVTRVRWGVAGGVAVETPAGTLRAQAAIVTVSTGVLSAGAIGFDPPLPAAVTDCIAALPMGLALKVVLRATGADRLDLPLHCSLDRRIARSGEPFMPFQCWPFGRDYVQGWIGGSPAWELARAGEAAAIDFALGELRRAFGGRVDALFAGGARLVTQWDADELVRGAYAYAIPGQADARMRLAEPLAGGRLCLAGEACHDGLAGTLGGAWLTGQAAAGHALRALGR